MKNTLHRIREALAAALGNLTRERFQQRELDRCQALAEQYRAVAEDARTEARACDMLAATYAARARAIRLEREAQVADEFRARQAAVPAMRMVNPPEA